MFTRMKKIKKGSVLKGFSSSKRTDPNVLSVFKGPTLMDFQGPTPFFPSPKLSPGLSNQPKLPIYSFWQSQSQIDNLPSRLCS